jgi:hypothetical protein
MFFHFVIFFQTLRCVNVRMAIFVCEITALFLYSTMLLARPILVNLLVPFVLTFNYGRCA